MEAVAIERVDMGPAVSNEVRVRSFADGDDARWDRFVDACPDATFFHRAGWREILENVIHHRCHYLLAERDGAVCGVPYAEGFKRVPFIGKGRRAVTTLSDLC